MIANWFCSTAGLFFSNAGYQVWLSATSVTDTTHCNSWQAPMWMPRSSLLTSLNTFTLVQGQRRHTHTHTHTHIAATDALTAATLPSTIYRSCPVYLLYVSIVLGIYCPVLCIDSLSLVSNVCVFACCSAWSCTPLCVVSWSWRNKFF